MSFEFEPESLKEEIRQELSELEKHYLAGETARDPLAEKTFTGIAGPFGIGKTTITNAISEFKPSISPINTTTTRRRKIGEDPSGFKTADEGVTFASFRDAVIKQEIVNFSVIPGGDIYGTFPEDFPTRYNIGPLLPSSIDQLSDAGFDETHFVYIVAPGELWKGFIEKSRRHMPHDRFQNRVHESIESTNFALNHTNKLIFVENSTEGHGARKPAMEIRNVTLKNIPPSLQINKAVEYLNEMNAVAKELALH